MKQDQLLKYKIGLGVIGVFAFIMLIIVLVQSGAVRHDKEVYKQADKVADQINDYTDSKSKVPTSLSAIGARENEDISYTKLSSLRYKFCVTYKADGDNYGSGERALNWYYGDEYSYEPSEEDSYLYLSHKHHKGENCQTVKIYSYNDDYYEDSTTDYNTQSL